MRLIDTNTIGPAAKILIPALYALCAAFILIGIWRTAGPFPLYWTHDLAIDLAEWVGGCALAALVAAVVSRRNAPILFVTILVLYLIAGVGLATCAGVALFLGSCYACGRLLLKAAFGDEADTAGFTRPLLVGLACELALFAVLIHLPDNSKRLYLVVLAAPFAFWIRKLTDAAFWRGAAQDARSRADAFNALPFVALVLACMVVGFVARFAFFPSVDFDNNIEHLRLWSELTYQHRFFFQVSDQLWDVEPFALDLARAVPSVMAGADARGAMSLALYALTLRQLWRISEQFSLRDLDRLLLLALFVSTPMTGWLITASTAEVMLAPLAAAAVRIIVESRTSTWRVDVTTVFGIAALCAAIKLPGMVLGAALLGAGAVAIFLRRDRSQPLLDAERQGPILPFLIPFTFIALIAYVIAWRVTHNPVFPMYNGVFKSPFFPAVNFMDERWMHKLGLMTYVTMFFKTSTFGEHLNFVAGFQYLFLLPLGLIALFRRVPLPVALAIVLPLAIFTPPMFLQLQYLRYLFPIAPLASLAIAALLIPGGTSTEGPSVRLFIGLCIALNLFFYPGVSWLYGTSPQRAYTAEGKAQVTAELNPVKSLVDDLNREGNREAVLFPAEEPFGAGLLAEPIYVNWYAPPRQAAFGAIHSAADAKAFLEQAKVKHVIVDKSQPVVAGAPTTVLRAYLDQNALPIADRGGFGRYDLVDTPPVYRPLVDLQQLLAGKSPQLDLPPASLAQLQGPDGLTLSQQPAHIAHAATNWATILRYHARFRCSSAGQFVAQVNWDKGPPYYRLAACDKAFVDYVETVAIPAGAARADIYATVRGADSGVVSNITLDTN